MRNELWGTIFVLLFDLIVGSLIYVCVKFTIPAIAAIITVTLSGVAGWATFEICKYWLLKLQEKWNLKRKQ